MENRILILAPRGRDAEVIQAVLQGQGMDCLACPDGATLLAELETDAAAAIVTEEMLAGGFDVSLGAFLERQPAWSDFPFVVLAMRQPGQRSAHAVASLQELGNLVLLERPVNPETLASAARSAFRARRRQYATRRHLIDIETAKEKVERLNADLEGRIATRTADLASANDRLMHEMAERERMQAGVVQGQKLEAIGRLTGGIAHDFNNILLVVNISLQLITRQAPDGRLAHYARRAKEAIDRGSRLTTQLLSFARSQSLLPRLHDMNVLVAHLRELIEVSVGAGVRVETELCGDEAWVKLDGAQLEMALLNMAVNSRDAMADGGRLSIRTALIDAPGAGRQVELSVQDTGCGIPAATLPKVFDPFFTTKVDGEGTGLGLSQVYGFAKQSGGGAEIRSALGVGTVVTLRFPLAQVGDPSAETRNQDSQAALPAKSDLRLEILVVEDDAGVREAIADGLRLLHYTVREASDGASGLQELRRRKPDLLMVDYLMPGMNGAEVVAAARQLYPELRILLATGYADMAEVERVVGAKSVLTKPFDVETLGNAVSRELARAQPSPVLTAG